jgi:hypothetical protein
MDDPSDLPPGTFYVPLVDGASNSAAPPSNKEDFSPRNLTLYSLVGLFFVTAAGTGALLYDIHPWFGGFVALAGTVGFIVTLALLLRYHPKTAHALIASIAALVTTWAFLVYVILTKPKEVIVHNRPTAEDIQKATAPIKTQLTNLQSELATAINDRNASGKTVDALTNELNSRRAQLGPRSPILGLDDARRWQIVKSMVNGLPSSTQQGCNVITAHDMRDAADFHRNMTVWGEV